MGQPLHLPHHPHLCPLRHRPKGSRPPIIHNLQPAIRLRARPLPPIRKSCPATTLLSLKRQSRPTRPIASADFGSAVEWAISPRKK